MKRTFLILFAYLLSGYAALSQTPVGSVFDETRLKMRVKQLDEFVARFNCEKDVEGKSIKDKEDTAMRKRYVAGLFDRNLLVNDSIKRKFIAFAEKVVNPKAPVYLRFADSDWTAEAICRATFNGKQVQISMFLKTDRVRDDEYKWAIVSADGEMFNLTPKQQNPNIRISPVDNELGFMNMSDISSGENRRNVVHYSPQGYSPDRLTVFNTLVYNGLLKINHVQKIVYRFEQVPGYVFTVEHFERATGNVGWLISKLIEIKNEKP
ncbi:MAG: hypothetical protein LBC98_09765 [Prevotellaceae bacterium]|nr:hypothetical protein [Prevotellaceae bacterium]